MRPIAINFVPLFGLAGIAVALLVKFYLKKPLPAAVFWGLVTALSPYLGFLILLWLLSRRT